MHDWPLVLEQWRRKRCGGDSLNSLIDNALLIRGDVVAYDSRCVSLQLVLGKKGEF